MTRNARELDLQRAADHWVGRFRAMAGPCEILVDTDDAAEARRLTTLCAREAWRIEDKYSRYRRGNVVDEINRSGGKPVHVDEETAGLLDFAQTLFELSGGRFDVTSGVLREAWVFDGSDRVPETGQVRPLLDRIGFARVMWRKPQLRLADGMEIDLGGIGKEYAVDRSAAIAAGESDSSCVVNFGGDLRVSRERQDGRPWRIGIDESAQMIELSSGGIATSGDARRYLLKNGVRYSHILNPTTGWPVENAPRSVTVVAESCTQAGMLATLAMLQGEGAEAFLEAQSAMFWCRRQDRVVAQ